ncbi:parvo_coat_N domain-containing protein [Trichonephila clavipes]|nr:parvo_coat_N domain-containing protein [Trichonephila clavipes]
MPFTKLEKRLARGDPGINRVDKGCKKHDIAYSKNKETKKDIIADEEFLNDLDAIENPTNGFYPLGERQGRVLIKPIIKAKKIFGMGYKMKCIKCKKETNFKNIEENTSKNNRRYIVETGYCGINELKRKTGLSQKEIIDFLQSQDVYTKFKPVIRNFRRRQTYASHIDDQ